MNNKAVKGTKTEKFSCDSTEDIDFNYDIPDDLKSGNYILKFKVNSSKGSELIEKNIVIKRQKSNDLIISLDKGIYKPGDTVRFRGLLLGKKDYSPVEKNVNISIYDGNDNKVYNEDVKTSEYGIVSGDFTLASEVNSGIYKIEFDFENEIFSKDFKVNPYITPKFEVELSNSKDTLKVDEIGTIKVVSKYFFGEPVKNAEVVLKIDGETITGITNAEGIYEYQYIPKNEGVKNYSVIVKDESNYIVEEASKISCSNNIFDIELMPEYGVLKNGIVNKVFVFTKTIDNIPVKTYSTIRFGNTERQVITDENGIGSFTLTDNDLQNYNENKFDVSSKNMNDEIVNKTFNLNIEAIKGTLIKTDEIKYVQGEDIEVSFDGLKDNDTNTVYAVKNNSVVKTFKTDSNKMKINLGEESGLITLYALENDGYSLYNKKTIFVKPSKSLTVNIETDKETYKPSEKMKLNIELKDENGNSIDGAILVSILDEAVQNLSNNDLNIDNLMLSLQDISLDGIMDMASLYANVLESKDDVVLNALLLKQKTTAPVIRKTVETTDFDKYRVEMFISIIAVAIIVVIYISVKSKGFRKFVVECLSFAFWVILFSMIMFWIIEIFGSMHESIILLAGLVIGVVLYAKIITKNKKAFLGNVIIFGILALLLNFAVLAINDTIKYDPEFFELVIYLIIIAICIGITVLTIILSKKKKEEKIFSRLGLAYLINVASSLLYLSNDDDMILLFTFFLNIVVGLIYFIIDIKKNNKSDFQKLKGKIVIDKTVVISIIVVFCVIGIFYGMVNSGFRKHYIYNEPDIMDSEAILSKSDSSSNSFRGKSIDDSLVYGYGAVTEEAQDTGSSVISMFKSDSTSLKGKNAETVEVKDEIYESSDDNIRNVFLDSLCFIPELVTENGKVQNEIKLSDNITSWQIQTIANTKNGRIGYGSKNIKVFKDFFVDFSLPTNSVVGDKVSIPVTVYNYTESAIVVNLNVKTDEWFKLEGFNNEISVESKNTALVYIPIEILKDGLNKFRVEAKAGNESDIIELSMNVKPNGVKVSKVVGSGIFEKNFDMDLIFDENHIEGTENLKVKLYPSTMSTVIENIDSILRMPTGCFEQTSSSLYPDAVVLKYIKENEINDSALKEKAIEYINSGYQRLLTFEVPGSNGGFSLYGKNPAEPILTSYGAMELKDISEVYNIDDKVLERMKEYLFDKQNTNGTFEITDKNSYFKNHVVSGTDELTLNAYMIWAISEAFPDDKRLDKSIEYLEKNLEKIEDNYTLALAANAFANTKSSSTSKAIKMLKNNIKDDADYSYIESKTTDYWGAKNNVQTIQTTALTSYAFSKTSDNSSTNKRLINYIQKQKDENGSWKSTQATVLSLKALVKYSSKTKIIDQDIKVKLNSDEQTVNISKNSLDLYELNFDSLEKENKLSFEAEKGEISYEVIKDYYVAYDKFFETANELKVESNMSSDKKVEFDEPSENALAKIAVQQGATISQVINITNTSKDVMRNGMVEISIPQGCSVREESLSELVAKNIIEKYEYNYSKVYLYIRDFEASNSLKLEIKYNANYPETITGGMVRFYDYYNPNTEGYSMPVVLEVK